MQYKAKDMYTLYTLGTALLLIQSTKNWYRLDVRNINNNNKKNKNKRMHYKRKILHFRRTRLYNMLLQGDLPVAINSMINYEFMD